MTNREKKLDTVNKLLALAKGTSFPAEAASARSKASRLISELVPPSTRSITFAIGNSLQIDINFL